MFCIALFVILISFINLHSQTIVVEWPGGKPKGNIEVFYSDEEARSISKTWGRK